MIKKTVVKTREKTQINKIRDEKGDFRTYSTEIQRSVRNFFENLYSEAGKQTTTTNKQKSLENLDTYHFLKLNQEDLYLQHVHSCIASSKVKH